MDEKLKEILESIVKKKSCHFIYDEEKNSFTIIFGSPFLFNRESHYVKKRLDVKGYKLTNFSSLNYSFSIAIK